MDAAAAESTDRALGALLGVHAGDSLGATLEFLGADECRRRYPRGLREIVGGGPFDWPPGSPTDDTDLTLCLARAYEDATADDLDALLHAAADHMLAWLERGPLDVGNATATGLHAYKTGGDPRRAGAGPGAAGNGSLMRTVPVAVARRPGPVLAVEARCLSAITHDDPRCQEACAAYSTAVSALVDDGDIERALRAAVDACRHRDVGEALERGARRDLADYEDQGRGFVLDSLEIGFAALFSGLGAEDAIVASVMLGGDTDTNAAIVGGLVGARDGHAALPPRWLDRLTAADELRRLGAVLLARRGVAGTT